jgi:predicted acylesterase/phospholipase RssA/CRP-like cAMP-binding protein
VLASPPVFEGVLTLLERAGVIGDGSASSRMGTRRDLASGEILVREGDTSDTVFILVSGSLVVSRSFDGAEMTLTTIDQPGSVVGEMVAMGGGRRSATVTAAKDTRLVSFSPGEFEALLAEEPELAEELAALAVRRAEEGELAELLARHFELKDDGALQAVRSTVRWRRLHQGEVLFNEGESSDSLFFVVRGRVAATRYDATEKQEVQLGVAGRGDVVGEVGLLRGRPRGATVIALRDSVVAEMDEPTFLDLVNRQPRVMIELALKAVARAEEVSAKSSPSTVLAIAISQRLRDEPLIELLAAELERFGTVEYLSAGRVESLLEAPGIAESVHGDMGEVRLSKLLHEAEIEADHLILDVGTEAGAWSRRALGMADRLLVVVPDDTKPDEVGRLESLLGGCPQGLQRTLLKVNRPEVDRPRGTSALVGRLAADDVIQVRRGSPADFARAARVAVGLADAFVLGGGGGRGFAHIGVLRALTELGIPVDLVGGTSIGGIIGAVIADRMDADELIEWASGHFARSMDYTIPVVSLVKGASIARSARETFGDRHIEDLWLTYYAMSTDLTASRSHVHRGGPIALAIRATSAIPGVMPPVPFGDHLLIDGGVLNNLPIDVARELTPTGRVVAVDVAPPRGPGARSDFGLSVSGWDALRSRGKRKYPGISAVLMRSMITASMRERDGQVLSGLADCYLDLDMRGVSMLEFDDPAGVARRGYEAAMPILEGWLEQQSLS